MRENTMDHPSRLTNVLGRSRFHDSNMTKLYAPLRRESRKCCISKDYRFIKGACTVSSANGQLSVDLAARCTHYGS